MKIIIGIDPGLAGTGYGFLEIVRGRLKHLAHGVITTVPAMSAGERLNVLHSAFSSLLERFRPAEAAVEEIYFAKNSKTFTGVAQAKGVILLALAQNGVPAAEYSPLQIKQAVVGHGRAEKTQVQELVRLILGLREAPSPDHAADALAAAICHSHQAQVRRLTTGKK